MSSGLQLARITVYSTLAVVQMLSNEPPDLAGGAVLSGLILLILLPLILLQRLFIGREQYTTVSSKMRVTRVTLGSQARRIACIGVSLFVALQTLVPFLRHARWKLHGAVGLFSIFHRLGHWIAGARCSAMMNSSPASRIL